FVFILFFFLIYLDLFFFFFFFQAEDGIRDRNVTGVQTCALPICFFNLFRIEQVLVPHAAQFDPVHAELFGGDFASTAEILRDFIVDDGNPERRIHTVTPSFSSRYFLLMAPDSFGVRALSGTTSSSTIAQPRKFTLCKAANAAGRSTRPLPNSTKRKGRFAFAPLGAGSTSLMRSEEH